MVQFRGCVVTSDAGLLAYRELDDALGLSAVAGETLADARTGKNGRHALVGLLRQSVFGRLAGYEDVNDADRLRHDPAMRWIVGGKAAQDRAASPSQIGASRRNGSRHLQTSLLFPTCPASGSISSMVIPALFGTLSVAHIVATLKAKPCARVTDKSSKATASVAKLLARTRIPLGQIAL